MSDEKNILPDNGGSGKYVRGALQVAGGIVPVAGGLLAALAGAWSERDQDKINEIFEEYILGLRQDMKEQKEALGAILDRLDLNDANVRERFASEGFQSLVEKAFRNWSGIDSDTKRVYIRNLLANAVSTRITSDDVVNLFISWLYSYSPLHFKVIGAIYNERDGISRGAIWDKIGKETAREDSAEADLYKLLFRDLSTGSIIRQHREKDHQGRFLTKPKTKNRGAGSSNTMTSAFDRQQLYELTSLGEQFVHYAMEDVTTKIGFQSSE